MKPNLVDRTCKLLKWVCNYTKLHNTTTREQLWYTPTQTTAQLWSPYAGDARSRNLYKKLAWKKWCQFTTVSCTKTTLQPITLHGLCRVPDSFCSGIELCSIWCKKFVPEKTGTRLTDTRASFWYKTTRTSFWYKFLKCMSPALGTCTTKAKYNGKKGKCRRWKWNRW